MYGKKKYNVYVYNLNPQWKVGTKKVINHPSKKESN